ncbi:LuxR C-terminal-related transcriptional regulator [uncultured Amnibacterium sp.]|uniref:helix-turn-helix transcriptional regulator n=1 Tax=uncultured Amnibacterium sp. TaxID=1631851 RepID=UPI0035CAA075
MAIDARGDVEGEARLALAAHDHERAAALLRTAVADQPAPRERALLLIDLTAAEARAGRTDAAWDAARDAIAVGRALGDGDVLADAVLAAPLRGYGGWAEAAEHHALAAEALRSAREPVRRRRLESLLATTTDTWTVPFPEAGPIPDGSSPDARFDWLRARCEALQHVRYAAERLALAALARDLAGDRTDEYQGWAALWEATASAQLGRRLELDAAIMRLRGVCARLREPVWSWRLGTELAALALLDGYVDDSARLARDALAAAGEPAPLEARFVDLILRSEIAVRSKRGLDGIDAELRVQLIGMPFFAQGWRAGVLIAAGRREEGAAIWRALRPVITRLPEAPTEWLVALAGYARVAIALEDRESAAVLLELLRPVDGFQVVGSAQAENGGPVALLLGCLEALLDDRAAARRLLHAAVAQADRMHDPFHAAQARAALTALGAETGPLTARELEVARQVAQGLGNRAIAERLHLSTRTVENHVAHILTKLGVGSRSAIAAWATRRDQA